MKISYEREKFLEAFHHAASVVPSRSPKPVLKNVRLDVSREGGTMMGTDLEIGVRVELSGLEIEEPGSVLLPAGQMMDILRESKDEKLSLEKDRSGVVVRGQRSLFRLPGEDVESFPPVRTFQEEKYHEISTSLFRQMIRRTVFATDMENPRYALGGVHWELTEDRAIAVATDGRRLAKEEGPARSVGGHTTGEASSIISVRAVQLMERIFTDSEENLQIAFRENDVLVRSPRITIYSLLVEGRFPRWREVFPKTPHPVQVELAAEPFYQAVREAAIMTSQEHRGIRLTFGEGKVVLTAQESDLGESRIELPISYEGPEMPVALNHRFLIDFLRVLDQETTFTMAMKDSESPVLFRTQNNYEYIVMPLALQGS
ncbi:MAG TPA: DNA polymerase III subunit beta [Thermoguttaceae bacterium]|nr:DNA polymerase III subunit beta [Thermoguttaceae bacterium]HPP51377.1 DNA polymerase III subunit beta [Thermoguttaceae bacterium]